MSAHATLDPRKAFPEHDGRCDHDDGGCGQPARLAKLAAAQPAGAGAYGLGWKASAPAASVALYCSHEHADQQPTATREAAERIFRSLPPVGSGAAVRVWRELLDAYPDPVALASPWNGRHG
jgi:hypothetical protein